MGDLGRQRGFDPRPPEPPCRDVMGPPLSKHLFYQHLPRHVLSGHLRLQGEKHVTRRRLGAGSPQQEPVCSMTLSDP